LATQSPFFGKRDREAESLTSRPAPLMGSNTNLSGTPVNPSTLTTQAANAAASVAKEGGSKLTVGPNIKLKGVEIDDCDTLVVEGRVEATMVSRIIQIAQNGAFNGKVDVEVAEVHGHFQGEMTARKKLVVHSGGRVSGKIRYGRMQVHEGGQMSGDIGAIADAPAVAVAR